MMPPPAIMLRLTARASKAKWGLYLLPRLRINPTVATIATSDASLFPAERGHLGRGGFSLAARSGSPLDVRQCRGGCRLEGRAPLNTNSDASEVVDG